MTSLKMATRFEMLPPSMLSPCLPWFLNGCSELVDYLLGHVSLFVLEFTLFTQIILCNKSVDRVIKEFVGFAEAGSCGLTFVV